MWKNLSQYRDFALLLLRIGLGIMFLYHGWPKISGGSDKWIQLGGAMRVLGITFFPIFWGLMAALTEFLGGVLLIVGAVFRPTALLLAFVMLVAALMHLNGKGGLQEAAHAIEVGLVFLALVFLGPGRFSVDRS